MILSKHASPSSSLWSKFCWQMSKRVCLCSTVSCFGIHLALTVWKPSLLWMISQAEPWIMYRWFATSPTVSCLSNRTMSCMCSMLSSVVAVDGRLDPSSCVTLMWSFLNCSIHSQTLCCGKTLFPYCAESLQWILAPDTPSDYKKWITECCSSVVQTESRVAMVNGTVATKELT